jgi:hypothetical protein
MLQPGDVFLTRGLGPLSRLIRVFTRGFGERRTQVNHVGLVVQEGLPPVAVAVEALSRVRRHPLGSRYGRASRQEIAVFRPLNLSEKEIATVVSAAEGYVGRRYGYLKIVAHLLDWLLLGAYLFRRLARMDDYPICSWLVAHSFAKVGKTFGVPPGAASPDDIWDFAVQETRKYKMVHPLGPMLGNGGVVAAEPEPS